MITKIKIDDNEDLRGILMNEYDNRSQKELCQYALCLAKHITNIVKLSDPLFEEGYSVNEAWQQGDARMHDVRQASFKIHKLARECNDKILATAIRVVGHAVASGHMKEHAMVASDYAIKVINLLYDKDKVDEERTWQIETLKSMINS